MKILKYKTEGGEWQEYRPVVQNNQSALPTKIYATSELGQLFARPDGFNYPAWPAGNLRYDKTLRKFVCLVLATDRHISATKSTYQRVIIDPYTYATSDMEECVYQDDSGTVLKVGLGNTSFAILGDGAYLQWKKSTDGAVHRWTSPDRGKTWVQGESVTGMFSSGSPWNIIELSSGRLLASKDVANNGFRYSDDKGVTWKSVTPAGTPGDYNAEATFAELSGGKIIAIARKNMSGTGWSSSGDSDHAIYSISADYGETWTAWQESTTIDNMNASSATTIVHDGIVEVFAASRWYHKGDYANTDYTNTGKSGAITHYVATFENALKDNFTKIGVVAYANAIGDGSSQDFHCPCAAVDAEGRMLLVYFDRVSPYNLEITNYYFVRGQLGGIVNCANDTIVSSVLSYSSKKVQELITNANEKIMALQYALSKIPSSGVAEPEVPADEILWTFSWENNGTDKLYLAKDSPIYGNMWSKNTYYGEAKPGEFRQALIMLPITKNNFAMEITFSAIVANTSNEYRVVLENGAYWFSPSNWSAYPFNDMQKDVPVTIRFVYRQGKKLKVSCEAKGIETEIGLGNSFSIEENQYFPIDDATCCGEKGVDKMTPTAPAVPYFYMYPGHMGSTFKAFKYGEWD